MVTSTHRWAFVFPGQGSQSVGMGRELAEAQPAAMRVWDEAERTLGLPLKSIAWDGPEDVLTRTENAQPALLTASVAAMRVVEHVFGITARAAAGHSAGEYAALVAASSLHMPDALKVIRARGEAMAEAGRQAGGGMAAVLGADTEILCRVVDETEGVVIANLNGPGQVVVSGTEDGLAALEFRIGETGARRFVRLNVAGPFHSPAMEPAAAAVQRALDAVVVHDPVAPVYANVTARQEIGAAEVKANLVRQVTGQVRWEQTIRNMVSDGYTHYVELGAGNVLTGLIRRIDREVVSLPLNNLETLEGFRKALES